MAFVFSPSNMSTYKQCPRRFQAQSITKELPWRASEQKSRGTLVHSCMERALQRGFEDVVQWPENVNTQYVQTVVDSAREMLKLPGVKLYTEYEMCLTNAWKPTGWWDSDAYLRAKADAIIVAPGEMAAIIDTKTGKVWDKDAFQLRVECLIAKYIFGVDRAKWIYWYVDSGETVSGDIDLEAGLYGVEDILTLMRDMTASINSNYFPAKRNRFCRFCDLKDKPGACGL